MKFGKHIHATHRMNNEISGDPRAFHLRPSSDQIPLRKNSVLIKNITPVKH